MRGATACFYSCHPVHFISIHAPHAGSDPFTLLFFQCHLISIHAPHAGSDRAGNGGRPDIGNFNPRSPCGERPERFPDDSDLWLFQSTLPMRGATTVYQPRRDLYRISIHAPHAGSDCREGRFHRERADFNPRSPCGERRCYLILLDIEPKFQSTLPMRGATDLSIPNGATSFISIHAPHAGSDSVNSGGGSSARISIHAPHAGSDCWLPY